jgi:hypothetical protein
MQSWTFCDVTRAMDELTTLGPTLKASTQTRHTQSFLRKNVKTGLFGLDTNAKRNAKYGYVPNAGTREFVSDTRDSSILANIVCPFDIFIQ